MRSSRAREIELPEHNCLITCPTFGVSPCDEAPTGGESHRTETEQFVNSFLGNSLLGVISAFTGLGLSE